MESTTRTIRTAVVSFTQALTGASANKSQNYIGSHQFVPPQLPLPDPSMPSTLIIFRRIMIEITEIQKLGVGLGGFGVFFLFLGMLLLFDKGLLAIGNLFCIAG